MYNEEKNKELQNVKNINQITISEQILAIIINIVGKGSFNKKKDTYIIEPAATDEYVIHVNEEAVEIRIVTTKWIKGGYEPILSSEVYMSIKHDELLALSKDERINMLQEAVNKVIK